MPLQVGAYFHVEVLYAAHGSGDGIPSIHHVSEVLRRLKAYLYALCHTAPLCTLSNNCLILWVKKDRGPSRPADETI